MNWEDANESYQQAMGAEADLKAAALVLAGTAFCIRFGVPVSDEFQSHITAMAAAHRIRTLDWPLESVGDRVREWANGIVYNAYLKMQGRLV